MWSWVCQIFLGNCMESMLKITYTLSKLGNFAVWNALLREWSNKTQVVRKYLLKYISDKTFIRIYKVLSKFNK